jgi:Rps23 Pro-64 3,4-dihydroxylase Tpa1-like proline 4-hydroxylase
VVREKLLVVSVLIGDTFIKSIPAFLAPPSVKKLSHIITTSFASNWSVSRHASNHFLLGFASGRVITSIPFSSNV